MGHQDSAGSGTTSKSQGRWRAFHDKFVVEERYIDPADRRRLYRASVILAVVGLALFIATLISVV